jgi:hypothetical protein
VQRQSYGVRDKRHSLLLVLLVVGLLAGLAPAAYATPADPSWIGGFWDDDDFDSAIMFIVGACATEVVESSDPAPHWVPVALITLHDSNVSRLTPRAAASPRAPPLASAPAL